MSLNTKMKIKTMLATLGVLLSGSAMAQSGSCFMDAGLAPDALICVCDQNQSLQKCLAFMDANAGPFPVAWSVPYIGRTVTIDKQNNLVQQVLNGNNVGGQVPSVLFGASVKFFNGDYVASLELDVNGTALSFTPTSREKLLCVDHRCYMAD